MVVSERRGEHARRSLQRLRGAGRAASALLVEISAPVLSDVVVLRATVADVARVAAAEERVDGPMQDQEFRS